MLFARSEKTQNDVVNNSTHEAVVERLQAQIAERQRLTSQLVSLFEEEKLLKQQADELKEAIVDLEDQVQESQEQLQEIRCSDERSGEIFLEKITGHTSGKRGLLPEMML